MRWYECKLNKVQTNLWSGLQQDVDGWSCWWRYWWGWRWCEVLLRSKQRRGESSWCSSPGSLPAARFSWFLVALNVVSLFRLHQARVFKMLSRSRRRTAGRYGRSTVPVVVKYQIASELISFPSVDLESPLMPDFFIISTIFGPFPMNANNILPFRDPVETTK